MDKIRQKLVRWKIKQQTIKLDKKIRDEMMLIVANIEEIMNNMKTEEQYKHLLTKDKFKIEVNR